MLGFRPDATRRGRLFPWRKGRRRYWPPLPAAGENAFGGGCEGAEGAGSERTLTDQDAAFHQLVTRQSRFVFRVAYAVLRNAHDAEDVVQEAFLKLYRNGSWHRMENEKAFLARTVWRIAADAAAARRPHAELDAAADGLVSAERTPEQETLRAEAHAGIHRLIDSLPEELRQVVALSGIRELNSREVAAVMGIPEGTVRTRLLRARQMLREKMVAADRRSGLARGDAEPRTMLCPSLERDGGYGQ
jgi:RNA polymerase sigma-70 factor (ECF subfamily)